MLNYIWIFLVIIAILVALGNDIIDEVYNTYQNNLPLEVQLQIDNDTNIPLNITGNLSIAKKAFEDFYKTTILPEIVVQPVAINLHESGGGTFFISPTNTSPMIWQKMLKGASSKDRLSGKIISLNYYDGKNAKASIVFEPIHFIKLKAVTQAAIDFVNTAVEISLGLIGVMALWLGLIKIAEEAGLLKILTRLLTPITRQLFPDIPSDHPAISAIIMNTAANMLGLSNAATPIGLKAMEELNKLNPRVGTATNAMITFLAINTGGLILIPATAIAVRAAAGSANPGIIIGTSIFGAACATIAGVLASKILQRLPRYKKDIAKIEHNKGITNG